MKKRIVSAVLCTAMVAGSLAGCGSKKAEETTAAATEAATEATEAAEEKTEAAEGETEAAAEALSLIHI